MPCPSRPNRWPAYARVPPFLPVPLRARVDGWTADRQAHFIGHLAETGSISQAALRVGMSRMAAYRLRRCAGAESWAHAWDVVLARWAGAEPPKRKVTAAERADHAFDGPYIILMRRARFVRAIRKPAAAALLRHLRWLDATLSRREGNA